MSSPDPEDFVFENKSDLLAKLKPFKDARFKSFKTYAEALRFAEIGFPLLQQQTSSMIESIKCELDIYDFFCTSNTTIKVIRFTFVIVCLNESWAKFLVSNHPGLRKMKNIFSEKHISTFCPD